jgi:hypothetical protein
MKLADILAANGGTLPHLAGGSEKTEAEAGAKATAETLIKVETEARKAAVTGVEAQVLTAEEEAYEELAAVNAAILSLGLRFLGAYDAAVVYVANDIVTEAGKAYLFIRPSENETLASEEATAGNCVLRGLA